MDKRFVGVIVAILLVFGGIVLFNGNKTDDTSASSVQPTNHVEGKNTTKVTLIEYGDYQCPACLQYYPAVKQVTEAYKDRITIQFRNFPLTSIHPNAFAGARAAEAANLQGKFWEMHDMLYGNQNAWSSSSKPTNLFNEYAVQLGLNAEKFKQDYISNKVNDLINADRDAGTKLGISGTPTFFLNGKMLKNPQPTFENFKKLIDAEIAAQAKK